MNWRRVHPQGKDPKHHKEWRGGRGRYRIIWRDQVFGVAVPPAFQISFREKVGDREIWELVDRAKPLKRTLKAAKRACEQHANPPETRKKRAVHRKRN
jgi:hypothetical protein